MKGTGINFWIRYYQGLIDILKDNSADPMWNQSLYLFVSIPVGAGEKAKEKKTLKESKNKALSCKPKGRRINYEYPYMNQHLQSPVNDWFLRKLNI